MVQFVHEDGRLYERKIKLNGRKTAKKHLGEPLKTVPQDASLSPPPPP